MCPNVIILYTGILISNKYDSLLFATKWAQMPNIMSGKEVTFMWRDKFQISQAIFHPWMVKNEKKEKKTKKEEKTEFLTICKGWGILLRGGIVGYYVIHFG